MSIKKLGGTRLRLIVGLGAVLAVFGAVAAFSAPKVHQPFSIFFSSDVPGGTDATLNVSGLSDSVDYYAIPVNRESNSNLIGWAFHATIPAGSEPVLFVGSSPPKIYINDNMGGTNPYADKSTSSGAMTLDIQTKDDSFTYGDELTSVKVYRSSDDELMGTANITILSQQ